MRATILAPDEEIIKRKRREELEGKERAHDAYVRATKRMRVERALRLARIAPESEFTQGYHAALGDFAQAVAEEDRRDV